MQTRLGAGYTIAVSVDGSGSGGSADITLYEAVWSLFYLSSEGLGSWIKTTRAPVVIKNRHWAFGFKMDIGTSPNGNGAIDHMYNNIREIALKYGISSVDRIIR